MWMDVGCLPHASKGVQTQPLQKPLKVLLGSLSVWIRLGQVAGLHIPVDLGDGTLLSRGCVRSSQPMCVCVCESQLLHQPPRNAQENRTTWENSCIGKLHLTLHWWLGLVLDGWVPSPCVKRSSDPTTLLQTSESSRIRVLGPSVHPCASGECAEPTVGGVRSPQRESWPKCSEPKGEVIGTVAKTQGGKYCEWLRILFAQLWNHG